MRINTPKTTVGVKNTSTNHDPEFQTAGSSGFDIRAKLDMEIVIQPSEYIMVPTGLHFAIPEGLEIQVRSRSGLAAKHGIAVLNGVGTIDSDYTGEVKVLLINHGKSPFIIENGDRIAQGVIMPVLNKTSIDLVNVSDITENDTRGSGGFGSTGVK